MALVIQHSKLNDVKQYNVNIERLRTKSGKEIAKITICNQNGVLELSKNWQLMTLTNESD